MRIQHNILAMNSYRNYTNNTNALGKNLEKLSSGYKINRAGDDAAGLAISEKMRAQIQGLNAAQKNVKDAISFVKTAEGAMQEIQDMLSRMKYLATQSANGTYDNEVDRKALQDEVDSLLAEIDRIADSANFNGIYMLNGGAGNTSSTTASTTPEVPEDPEDPEDPVINPPTGGATGTNDAGIGEVTVEFGEDATDDQKNDLIDALTQATVTVKATCSTGSVSPGTPDGITITGLPSGYTAKYLDADEKETAWPAGGQFTIGSATGNVKDSVTINLYDDDDVLVGTITIDISALEDADDTTGNTSTIEFAAADEASVISGNTAVGASLKASEDEDDKETGLEATISKNELSGVDFSSSSSTKLSEDSHDGKEITIKLGADGPEFTVKLAVSATKTETEYNDDNNVATVYFKDDETYAKDIISTIEAAFADMVNTWTQNKAAGEDEFTGYEGITINLKSDDGTIESITYDTVKYVKDADEADADNKIDNDNKASGSDAAVPKNTKVEIDLSKVEGNFKEGDRVTIGGKVFEFKKAAAEAPKVDDDDDDDDDGKVEGDEDDDDEVALAALTGGTGTAGDPYTVEPGATLAESLQSLADAITEANKDDSLGFSASFDPKTGKLTLTTTKDFDSIEEFKKAAAIEFNEDSEVGAAIKKAWDEAVEEKADELNDKLEGNYSIKMQIGDSSNKFDQMTIKIKSMKTESLGIDGLKIDTIDDAHEAIDTIKAAINTVSSVRGQLGAYQNRLEHTQNNLSVMTENIQDAESTIRDTDVADEMMAYVKNNILVQSAQAMLAQANQVPQGVLQLLG